MPRMPDESPPFGAARAFETRCPSCGAPMRFESAASIRAVCAYCRSQVVRRDVDVEALGKVAELVRDASPFRLGVRGRYRENELLVVGRIQLAYEAGLWNEWAIVLDDGSWRWLGDAAGEYTVTDRVDGPGIPPFEKLPLGRAIRIADKDYVVADRREARCVSGEGELPANLRPGYAFKYVDLRTDEDDFATIDYSEDPPLAFAGAVVELRDLHPEGLRTFRGWRPYA